MQHVMGIFEGISQKLRVKIEGRVGKSPLSNHHFEVADLSPIHFSKTTSRHRWYQKGSKYWCFTRVFRFLKLDAFHVMVVFLKGFLKN